MDDLIGRQTAIDVVDRIAEGKITLNDARDLIRMFEPRQPERKKGKWNMLSDDTFHCLECGKTFIVTQGTDHMRFCPNCGADMR